MIPKSPRAPLPLHRLAFVALVAFMLAEAPPARAADGQAWTGLEARVRVAKGTWWMPTAARWITESRFGGSRDGLSFLLTRIGPMWDLHPNLLFNLQGVQAFESDSEGRLRPVSRIEIEPNVRVRVGPFSTNLRQRAELRWLGAETSYRHRVQIRVNYQPKGAHVAPYVSVEGLGMPGLRVGELRNVVGISLFAGEHLRLDFGYMFRPRVTRDDWQTTHAGVFWLTFEPKIPAVIESGGG